MTNEAASGFFQWTGPAAIGVDVGSAEGGLPFMYYRDDGFVGLFHDCQSVRLIDISDQGVRLDVAQLDPVAQHIESRHLLLSDEGIRTHPFMLRYAWPSELDLMARIAGLRLQER